jgi:putative ABC transport system substrate-binding protein
MMKRRDIITLLGGAAATWPLAARAQQPERVGRVGVLMNLAADDPEGLARFAVFVQELQQLGWNEGRNMRIDHRWAGGSVELFRKYALELVALAAGCHPRLWLSEYSGAPPRYSLRAGRVRVGR